MKTNINTIATLLERKNIVNGCWEFTGALNRSDYGVIGYQGKVVFTHRLAYQELVGEIPEGLFVCHKCDNPKCFNPDHLFLGTALDNTRDMIQKGRHNYGILTHCKKGHEFTPDNIKYSGTVKLCNQCIAEKKEARKQKAIEKQLELEMARRIMYSYHKHV